MTYFLPLLSFFLFTQFASAQVPHHAKHNMILIGENEIFASHIVYLEPHNFQIIMQLTLNQANAKIYHDARLAHPNKQFIFLLDATLQQFESVSEISGKVFYTDEDGNGSDKQVEVIPSLKLKKPEFKILYFQELPLSLAAPVPAPN